jgi:uncharacterized phage-associated protein
MNQVCAVMPKAKPFGHNPSAKSGYRDKIIAPASFVFLSNCETRARNPHSIIATVGTTQEEAMLVSHEREKMINAIIYFANHTRHLGKIKLFKLLYLLDFEHYSQTGRSVTGLDYRAWKFGPVPVALEQEWEEPEADMAQAIRIEPERVIDYVRETVAAQTEFDDSHFSNRELRIMAKLAEQYREELSHRMIDVTHAENGAWARVWNGGRGFDQPIDYAMSLRDDDPHRAAILEFAREHQALVQTNQTTRG